MLTQGVIGSMWPRNEYLLGRETNTYEIKMPEEFDKLNLPKHQGYKVYYEDNLDKPPSSWMTKTVANRISLLSNLHPNKTYKISVKAFTSAGEGPSSEAVSILMQEKGVFGWQITCLIKLLITDPACNFQFLLSICWISFCFVSWD